ELARIWPQLGDLPPKIAEQVEIDAKYEVYLSRQAADIAAYRRGEGPGIPEGVGYLPHPRASPRNSAKIQFPPPPPTGPTPRTIGHAARMDGITPAALTLLVAYLKRNGRRAKAAVAGR